MLSRRLAVLAVSVTAAAGLSACDKDDNPTKADTEGVYVTVDQLKYQVQISRQLNPANVEDRNYLIGIPAQAQGLSADQVWFAVFLRVENDSSTSSRAAGEFEMRDTQGNTFEPVDLGRANVFAYRPALVAAHDVLNVNGTIPAPNSAAVEGATQGAMLLFKVPRASLQNRPLELEIASPTGGGSASVDLDV